MTETERRRDRALAAAGGRLDDAERERHRSAGGDLTNTMRLVLRHLRPEVSELDAAAELALEARRQPETSRLERRYRPSCDHG